MVFPLLKSKKTLGERLISKPVTELIIEPQIAGVAGASVKKESRVWLKLDMAPEAPQIPILPRSFRR